MGSLFKVFFCIRTQLLMAKCVVNCCLSVFLNIYVCNFERSGVSSRITRHYCSKDNNQLSGHNSSDCTAFDFRLHNYCDSKNRQRELAKRHWQFINKLYHQAKLAYVFSWRRFMNTNTGDSLIEQQKYSHIAENYNYQRHNTTLYYDTVTNVINLFNIRHIFHKNLVQKVCLQNWPKLCKHLACCTTV